MEKKLLNWLKANTGRIFSSPRKKTFGSRAQDFKIIEINEERKQVIIQFVESQRIGLPLTFSMFDRALMFMINKES